MAKSKDNKQEVSQPDYYFENGLMVMTEEYHLKRGLCCGSRCRHCPYEHENVDEEMKKNNYLKINQYNCCFNLTLSYTSLTASSSHQSSTAHIFHYYLYPECICKVYPYE